MSIITRPDGFHRAVPEDDYHAPEIGLVSKSALDQFMRSPAHYRAWLRGELDHDSDAMAFGRAFHCALLEPKRFALSYAAAPDFGDCRFKENKARRAEWQEENAGRALISESTLTTIIGMVRSCQSHILVREMLSHGDEEVTALWTDRATGLRCKTRCDFWQASRGLVADVKTCEDAREPAFKRAVVNYGYHRQDALYRMGMAACGAPVQFFVLIACEKTPPYAVATYQLDVAAIQLGWSSVRHSIDRMAECMRTDTWPAYDETIRTLELPPWAA